MCFVFVFLRPVAPQDVSIRVLPSLDSIGSDLALDPDACSSRTTQSVLVIAGVSLALRDAQARRGKAPASSRCHGSPFFQGGGLLHAQAETDSLSASREAPASSCSLRFKLFVGGGENSPQTHAYSDGLRASRVVQGSGICDLEEHAGRIELWSRRREDFKL